MRLLHTADWHLGKLLKGVDRTPEIAAALRELSESVSSAVVHELEQRRHRRLTRGKKSDRRLPFAD